MDEGFGSHVFRALHFVHDLEGLSLFPSKGLFIVVLAGPSDAIKDDAAACGVPEEVDDEEDEGDEYGGAERGEKANDDPVNGRRWRCWGHCAVLG